MTMQPATTSAHARVYPYGWERLDGTHIADASPTNEIIGGARYHTTEAAVAALTHADVRRGLRGDYSARLLVFAVDADGRMTLTARVERARLV